ncbi:MAG: hypothetical protein LBR15_04110, partial [Methanobrevibacter sp.]|nr:hypothetical protein [Candidatus Methanovirga australis]
MNNKFSGDFGDGGGVYGGTVNHCNITKNKAYWGGGVSNGRYVNYNRIYDNSAFPYTDGARDKNVNNDDFSGNYDFNWWGTNDISKAGISRGSLPNNHYIVKLANKGSTQLKYDMVLNDSSTNVDILPSFNGFLQFNNENFVFDGSKSHIFNVPSDFSIFVDDYMYSSSNFFNKIYVSKDGSDSNLGNSPGCPVQSINHALNSVSDHGTVVLMSDFNVTDTIFVNKSVTIKKWESKQDKVFLDAMYKTRIMFINSGLNVYLDGLSFNKGNDSDGGGLLTVDSAVHINNCNFSNNMALNKGGALLALESPVNSSESKKSSSLSFRGNSSRNNLSRILSRDSLESSQNSSETVSPVLDIKNSSFIGNWANQSSAVFSTVQHVNLSSTNF